MYKYCSINRIHTSCCRLALFTPWEKQCESATAWFLISIRSPQDLSSRLLGVAKEAPSQKIQHFTSAIASRIMQPWSQRWLQDSSSRFSQLNEGVTCTLIFAHLFTLSIHTSLLYVFTWQAWHWIAPLFHIFSASPRMRETHRTNYEMLHPRFGASRQYSSSWSKFSRIWSNSTWRFSRSARCSITRANSSCTALSSSCVVCQSLTKSCSFHKEIRFWQVPNASMYRFEISSRVSPLTVAALASLFGSRFKWLKSPKRLRPGAPAQPAAKMQKLRGDVWSMDMEWHTLPTESPDPILDTTELNSFWHTMPAIMMLLCQLYTIVTYDFRMKFMVCRLENTMPRVHAETCTYVPMSSTPVKCRLPATKVRCPATKARCSATKVRCSATKVRCATPKVRCATQKGGYPSNSYNASKNPMSNWLIYCSFCMRYLLTLLFDLVRMQNHLALRGFRCYVHKTISFPQTCMSIIIRNRHSF